MVRSTTRHNLWVSVLPDPGVQAREPAVLGMHGVPLSSFSIFRPCIVLQTPPITGSDITNEN